ncbi:MAG: hypothetical protein KOO69_03575, partial [Victivallales bacterium]|nr:hypothetical protein [Victivallales bacterium]
MNNLSETYFNIQSRLFPMVEEEIGELTKKQQEFLRIIELVKPSRFIAGILSCCETKNSARSALECASP